MRKPSILLFLVIVLSSLWSDDKPLQFNRLSLREGLSSNSVYCVHQDHLGFIWFGTFSGLDRFDGREIEIFRPEPMNPESISGSIIFDILEDSSNRLWIATDGGGLNLYDFEQGTFSSFQNDPSNPDSLSSQKLFCLEEDADGRIWIGTADSGLCLFSVENQLFLRYSAATTPGLESDVIRVLLRDSLDRMWIGTQAGGVSMSDGDFHLSNYLNGITIREILEDSRGRIWLGTENNGLYLAQTQGEEITFRRYLDGLTVRSLAEDEAGRLWVGTERNGLVLFDGSAVVRTVNAVKEDDLSLSSDFIRDIYIDKSGLVWIATRGGGVNRYNPRSDSFTSHFRGSYTFREILETSAGEIVFASDGQGLLLLDSEGMAGSFEELTGVALPSRHLYSLEEDDRGNLWVGSDGDGLYRIDCENLIVTEFRNDSEDPQSISSDVIWSLFNDSSGNLWIGTEGGGLNRYEPESNSFVRYYSDPDDGHTLLGSSVRTILEDSRGDLWIGTWDGGLSRMQAGTQRFITYTRDPDDPTSISDNSVNCIVESNDGLLWVGTAGGGLNLLDPETEEFTAFRQSDGLADDTVFGIVPDGAGFLWISTADGLSRLDLITYQFTNFWSSDGLISNEFSRNAYLKTSIGEIFFGTAAGIIRFLPGAVRINNYRPPIRITDFSLFNESVNDTPVIGNRVYLDRDISVSSQVNVYPGDSFIGFSFVSLDYSNPEKNQYAVKLEGFDADWHYLGSSNRFYYASLPPGEYTFQVFGSNSNGAWSRDLAEIAVTVLPSFYQTWPFFGAVILTVAAISYLVSRIRMAGLNRHNRLLQQFSNYVQDVREEERKVIARDVHDELGQLLTTLKMHIFWLSRNAGSIREQRQARYESMLGIINTSLDWSKELATRLRPVVLDNLSLGEALEWLLHEHLVPSGLEVKHSIDPTPPMSPDRATAIFRIIQESMTNIVRHSQATRARLTLRVQNNHLLIDISDNGRGLSSEKLTNAESFGIIGMRERTKHLGGEIFINATSPGTHIHLRIPAEQ